MISPTEMLELVWRASSRVSIAVVPALGRRGPRRVSARIWGRFEGDDVVIEAATPNVDLARVARD